MNDFVYIADRSNPIALPEVPIVKRSAHKIAALDVGTRKKHIRLLEEMGANKSQIERYIPDDKVPVRQYFHSKTNQPMVGGDWDIDSDDDSTNDQWLHEDDNVCKFQGMYGIPQFALLLVPNFFLIVMDSSSSMTIRT